MRAIAFLLLLALARPALADPPPAAIAPPAEAEVTLPRDTVELILAEAATAAPARKALLECQDTVAKLARAAEPPSTWRTGLKWGGVTAAIVSAFFIGLTLR